ncbi:TPA: hypothetical protein ACH3X3_011500 [Trebouxia sp. C0006]
MNRVVGSRRQGKRAGSLDDSASDSGKILSYQRMPQDSPIKGIPADGTAELSSQPMPVSARLKHRVKTIPEPSHRSTTATSRVETALSSETSRSRLSTANLEQNHHAYRNHPQSLDYQDRTRQWLKSAQLAPPPHNQVARKQGAHANAAQHHQLSHLQPKLQKRSGWSAIFDCFKPQTIEFQHTQPAKG